MVKIQFSPSIWATLTMRSLATDDSELMLSNGESVAVPGLVAEDVTTFQLCWYGKQIVASVRQGIGLGVKIQSEIYNGSIGDDDRPQVEGLNTGGQVTVSHNIDSDNCEDCWTGTITDPCSDPTKTNCRDGEVTPAMAVTMEWEQDEVEDICCPELLALQGLYVATYQSVTHSPGGGQCCDEEFIGAEHEQCIYQWGGNVTIEECVGAESGFTAGPTIRVMKFPDGYRICGSFVITPQNVQWMGYGDLINPEDPFEVPDCTKISAGPFTLLCFTNADLFSFYGVGPHDGSPCEMHTMRMTVGAL